MNWHVRWVRWGFIARWPRSRFPHDEWRVCLYVDRWALWFWHPRHGEIGWLWPWRRDGDRRGRPWIDLNCGGYFWTLREMQEFWEGYWRALQERQDGSEPPLT